MSEVTANGNTYTDDRSGAKDMNDGGYRAHLIPMLSDVMVEIASASADAAAASAAAASAAGYAVALYGTSTTLAVIGTSSKSFTTQTDKSFSVGQWVGIAYSLGPTNYMVGQVTSYNTETGALVVDVVATGGSGTQASWVISPAGSPGPTGSTGPVFSQARTAVTSGTTLVAGDKGNVIDCTSGTFTLVFTAAATLTSGWWCEIRNSGTGDITLDPNSTEQIDGLTSFVMYPGEHRRVFCTGTAFVSLVLNPFYRVFTASGTWTEPPGYKLFQGLLWSAGGGGGRSGSGSFISCGGGSGACLPIHRPATTAGTSVTVTIATITSNQTGAGNGASGGNSSFGSQTGYGGGGGYGNGAAAGYGGGGGGALSAGTVGSTGLVAGGRPAVTGGGEGRDRDGFGGAMSGGSSAWGGAGGGGDSTTLGGDSVYGGGGGGRGSGTSNTGGASTFAGAGGAGSSASNGADGTAPAGGGGGTQTGSQAGAGARGELRIWGIV